MVICSYLWCTVGTQTYTFFSFTEIDPAPQGTYNATDGLSTALGIAQERLGQGDGDMESPWAPSLDSNIRVFVQNSKGKMTWGILTSALQGLMEASAGFNKFGTDSHQVPMIFQVNDGGWGETGMGYIGFLVNGTEDSCVYQIWSGGEMPCSDVEQRKGSLNI